ncbi:MAG: DUF2764 family protein [PVC group bacterium]
MNRNYYYFSATLPMLSFGIRPQVSNESFLMTASEHLTRRDFRIINNARLVPPESDGGGESALEEWIAFENSLRNELVNIRAKKMGRDPKEYFRGDYMPDPYIAAMLQEAAGADNPLMVERRIDLARWEKLGEIELQHYFDLQFLVVYFLKLQILNKWSSIREEKGMIKLDELLKPGKEPSS